MSLPQPEAMWARESHDSLCRFLQRRSNLALCFFVLSSLSLTVGVGGAWLLIQLASREGDHSTLFFPPTFGISSALLLAGSFTLQSASWNVRLERQRIFRRRLFQSLVVGTGFVLAQTFGMWCLLGQREAAVTIGLRDGAFAFVLMHGVHFVVALLFVVFVLLSALADRYDHEYSWGVTFCAWFWHALGIIWLVILSGFLIAILSTS